MAATSAKRVLVKDVNPFFICGLCKGYLVDATAMVECLDTFCRSCIVQHLKSTPYCPICEVQANKLNIFKSLRADRQKQLLVYKSVPHVFTDEVHRRMKYRMANDVKDSSITSPSFTDTLDDFLYHDTAKFSISLELESSDCGLQIPVHKRYLMCPATFPIRHLKKFIRLKYQLGPFHEIDVLYNSEVLEDRFTLRDVAYIFLWQGTEPLQFVYRIREKTTPPKLEPQKVEDVPVLAPPPPRPPSRMRSRGGLSSGGSSDESAGAQRRQLRQRSAKTAACNAIEAMDEETDIEEKPPLKRPRRTYKSPRRDSEEANPYRSTRGRTPRASVADMEDRYSRGTSSSRVYSFFSRDDDDDSSGSETKKNTIANSRPLRKKAADIYDFCLSNTEEEDNVTEDSNASWANPHKINNTDSDSKVPSKCRVEVSADSPEIGVRAGNNYHTKTYSKRSQGTKERRADIEIVVDDSVIDQYLVEEVVSTPAERDGSTQEDGMTNAEENGVEDTENDEDDEDEVEEGTREYFLTVDLDVDENAHDEEYVQANSPENQRDDKDAEEDKRTECKEKDGDNKITSCGMEEDCKEDEDLEKEIEKEIEEVEEDELSHGDDSIRHEVDDEHVDGEDALEEERDEMVEEVEDDETYMEEEIEEVREDSIAEECAEVEEVEDGEDTDKVTISVVVEDDDITEEEIAQVLAEEDEAQVEEVADRDDVAEDCIEEVAVEEESKESENNISDHNESLLEEIVTSSGSPTVEEDDAPEIVKERVFRKKSKKSKDSKHHRHHRHKLRWSPELVPSDTTNPNEAPMKLTLKLRPTPCISPGSSSSRKSPSSVCEDIPSKHRKVEECSQAYQASQKSPKSLPSPKHRNDSPSPKPNITAEQSPKEPPPKSPPRKTASPKFKILKEVPSPLAIPAKSPSPKAPISPHSSPHSPKLVHANVSNSSKLQVQTMPSSPKAPPSPKAPSPKAGATPPPISTELPVMEDKRPDIVFLEKRPVPDDVKERLMQMRAVRHKSVSSTCNGKETDTNKSFDLASKPESVVTSQSEIRPSFGTSMSFQAESTPRTPSPKNTTKQSCSSSRSDGTQAKTETVAEKPEFDVKTPASLSISKLEVGASRPRVAEPAVKRPALEILMLPPSPPPAPQKDSLEFIPFDIDGSKHQNISSMPSSHNRKTNHENDSDQHSSTFMKQQEFLEVLDLSGKPKAPSPSAVAVAKKGPAQSSITVIAQSLAQKQQQKELQQKQQQNQRQQQLQQQQLQQQQLQQQQLQQQQLQQQQLQQQQLQQQQLQQQQLQQQQLQQQLQQQQLQQQQLKQQQLQQQQLKQQQLQQQQLKQQQLKQQQLKQQQLKQQQLKQQQLQQQQQKQQQQQQHLQQQQIMLLQQQETIRDHRSQSLTTRHTSQSLISTTAMVPYNNMMMPFAESRALLPFSSNSSVHESSSELMIATQRTGTSIMPKCYSPEQPSLSPAAIRHKAMPGLNNLYPARRINSYSVTEVQKVNSTVSTVRPGPNQTVRNIPNPSALLQRHQIAQQHQQANLLKRAQTLAELELKERLKNFQNNVAANAINNNMLLNTAAITNNNNIPKAIMARNQPRSIEKVAAGLSMRAAVEAHAGK